MPLFRASFKDTRVTIRDIEADNYYAATLLAQDMASEGFDSDKFSVGWELAGVETIKGVVEKDASV